MSANVKQIENPHTWLYKKALCCPSYERSGGKILLNPIVVDAKIKSFYEAKTAQLMESFCKVAGIVAITPGKLSERQRHKYMENRIKDGSNVYYLFERHKMPADVFPRINLEDSVYIY